MEAAVQARMAGLSVLFGMLFGAGWWVFIDGYASCRSADPSCDPARATQGYAWIPLFGATLSFVMMNGMKWSELRDDMVSEPSTAAKARIFLIMALLIAVACMAGSGFIMSDKFLQVDTAYKWTGISGFVGTLIIIAAAFGMRMSTLPPE